MKFDWKRRLPHFITWILLLILFDLVIWLVKVKREERRKVLFLGEEGKTIIRAKEENKEKPRGEKISNEDEEKKERSDDE